MVVEWVRSCYQSQWAAIKGHPGVSVHGRYVRAGANASFFPGFTVFCSREWSKGEQDSFNGLGELRDVPHEWDNGRPPEHLPIQRNTGSVNCLGDGENELPWPVIHEINADVTGTVVVTGAIPSIRLDFAEPPGPCQAILAEDGNAILAEDGNAILAQCIACRSILAEDGNAILAEDGNAILAECD